MNATRPGALYADHLATLQQRATAALERGGFDHLVVPSGTLTTSCSTTAIIPMR